MKKNHGIKKTPFLNNNINVTLARESSQFSIKTYNSVEVFIIFTF